MTNNTIYLKDYNIHNNENIIVDHITNYIIFIIFIITILTFYITSIAILTINFWRWFKNQTIKIEKETTEEVKQKESLKNIKYKKIIWWSLIIEIIIIIIILILK